MEEIGGLAIDAAAHAAGVASPHEAATELDDALLFFRAWLSEPVTIGAVMPTRARLADAMSDAALGNPGVRAGKRIIELGGGTGPLTRALAMHAPDPGCITVVERNPVFQEVLRRRFPLVQVIPGEADRLATIARTYNVGPVGAVVSSLPRVGWPLARQRRILMQCFALLERDGEFLEFSYGPFSPVPRRLIRELGLSASRVRQVWRNLPPASIWSYRRA